MPADPPCSSARLMARASVPSCTEPPAPRPAQRTKPKTRPDVQQTFPGCRSTVQRSYCDDAIGDVKPCLLHALQTECTASVLPKV